MFGSQKDKAVKPRTYVRDPLAVIPMVPGHLEQKHDGRGMLHLKMTVPVSGLRARIGAWLRYDYSKKIELDEIGTAYYGLVDGRRTLRQIVAALRSTAGGEGSALEQHVLQFTRMLMTRGFVVLKVTEDNTLIK